MENRVLAIVENTKITEEDLQEIIIQYPEDKREYLKGEKGKKNLLDKIIKSQLLYCYGKEMDIDKSKEFQNRIEQYVKEAIIGETINRVIKDIKISEKDAEKYYLSNKEEFIVGEKVVAKHILVESMEEALRIKKDIESKIISFEEGAMKYSMCPSCMQGGSIGSFPKGKMYPEIDLVAFSIEINKISNPVETEMGYHLVLVEDKQEERLKEFQEVKMELIKKLIKVEEDKRLRECIESLRNKFKVYTNL